jgi:hypothetical protein
MKEANRKYDYVYMVSCYVTYVTEVSGILITKAERAKITY